MFSFFKFPTIVKFLHCASSQSHHSKDQDDNELRKEDLLKFKSQVHSNTIHSILHYFLSPFKLVTQCSVRQQINSAQNYQNKKYTSGDGQYFLTHASPPAIPPLIVGIIIY